jgi:membrane protease YdiL (CAAX protease family)
LKPDIAKIANYPVFIRLGLFILILLLTWLPLAIPIYLVISDPNLVSIITMGLLFINFLFLVKNWGKYIDRDQYIFATYGLKLNRINLIYLIQGLSIGLIFVISLFTAEQLLELIQINPQPSPLIGKIIFEGLLTGIGVGIAEEIFFRGWLLHELEKDYSPKISLSINALIFAILHFIKPLPEIIRTFPQFPGLLILGIILINAKRKHRNLLGIAIGLHSGLVWGYYIFNVGQLIQYYETISPLITGVDNNPLAGVMGILFLLILWWIYK